MLGISLIVWLNDQLQFERLLLPTITHGYQVGLDGSPLEYDLQIVFAVQKEGRVNIGQAYNAAMSEARHSIKIFAHQDIHIHDRHFVAKLSQMFEDPAVGVVGVVGSVVDTGAGFFHAEPRDQRGRINSFWYPHQQEQVKVIDGMVMATRQTMPFSEEYETVHMAIEDYCLQVREAGKQVWVVDSYIEHASPGNMNDAYWRSAEVHRRKWGHRLPPNLTPLPVLRRKGLSPLRVISEFEVCTV